MSNPSNTNNHQNIPQLKQICMPMNYSNITTSGNDPNITKASRYTQYVQTAKPKTVYVTSATTGLAAKGITFQAYSSPILVSLQFTNLKDFSMPREKIFSRINIR